MLTNLKIKNFKRFHGADIELGKAVVFVGPNNSGKTTALQALALWEIGLRKWNEKRSGRETPEKRPGVTINRRDLIAIPVPDANLLWGDLHVRDISRADGKQVTRNVRIDIVVSGLTEGNSWDCGFEFDYANEESFYCRPLRLSETKQTDRMPVPARAAGVRIAFLPPMSGLAANETRLDTGAINVRIGEGRTAEVLRNLCYQIHSRDDPKEWSELSTHITELFGVTLNPPKYVFERGEVTMTYRERSGTELDLSSAGRGLHQTLLLLAHLYAHPGTVLLLDEPDAHLEILRQRQMYQLLTEIAEAQDSQIVAASHSEVILNEAADRDIVVAFVGTPHRIDDRGSQVLKALKAVGFEQYYQAEQTGWVLYLEGSTDLAILNALARILDHPAQGVLQRPFVNYVQNLPNRARDHFFALREAKPDLVAFALYDRIPDVLQQGPPLTERKWQRREIENYLCYRETLVSYARCSGPDIGPLFDEHEAIRRIEAMEHAIEEVAAAMKTLGMPDPFSPDVKASDDFLDRVFRIYFDKLGLRILIAKTDYHTLAQYVPRELIDPEVAEVMDSIVQVATSGHPARPAL